jgi:hypothetical protein
MTITARGFAALAVLACAGCPAADVDNDGAEGEGESDVGEGEGEGRNGLPFCFVGDPNEPAEIVLVARVEVADELLSFDVDVVDGVEVPLVLPPQGGRIVLFSVRARNVSCNLDFSVTGLDTCTGITVGLEGRPILLVEGDDGFGRPAQAPRDYANLPLCPTFGSTRDLDGQPLNLRARANEQERPGEGAQRTHEINVTVTPVCADDDAECACLCDEDFINSVPAEEQCPTIHDNDIAFGECPAPCDAIDPCALGFHCEETSNGGAACVLDDRPAEPLFVPIGSPPWRPTDCLMVPGQVGDAANFQAAHDSFEAFWSLHRWDVAASSIAPDEPHAPPYDAEPSANAAALGLTPADFFTLSAWTAPAGVILYCVIVPDEGAVEGTSADFDTAAPIIPETLFPFFVDAGVLFNGTIVDGAFDGFYPPPSTFAFVGDVDGYSHMPLSFGENTAFISDGFDGGLMEFHVALTDANDDGWFVRFPFTIE